MNRPFLFLIQEAGRSVGVQFLEIEQNVVYRAQKGNQSFLMVNVDLGLNTTSAASLANSKSLASAVLQKENIPCVEHVFLLHPQSKYAYEDVPEKARQCFFAFGPELVVKPDNGMQGINVFKVNTISALDETIEHLFVNQQNVSLSPYYEADLEFRVVVLKQKAVLSFAKEKGASWKHNLTGGHGRVTELDVFPKSFVDKLHDLAVQAANALELTFCSVDVLNTAVGLKVLEVNASVYLSEYMKTSALAKQRVFQLYQDVFKAKFHDTLKDD